MLLHILAAFWREQSPPADAHPVTALLQGISCPANCRCVTARAQWALREGSAARRRAGSYPTLRDRAPGCARALGMLCCPACPAWSRANRFFSTVTTANFCLRQAQSLFLTAQLTLPFESAGQTVRMPSLAQKYTVCCCAGGRHGLGASLQGDLLPPLPP